MQIKKPVAYLARELAGGSSPEMLLDGILNEAEKQDQHLVVFRGGYLGKEPGAAIYDLVNADYHGVVAWASSDADDYTKNYFKRYGNLPIVTLTLQIPPHPVVMTDSYAGMRAVVEHLVKLHGKKKIVFIRGPEVHPSAIERLRAYQEVMRDNGLPAPEQLLSPFGSWDKSRGADMVKLFLDDRKLVPGKDFDAMICVNDNIAIGAIEEFQKRGVRVPDDVAVTGCNDVFDARALTPPVTTVSLPADEQAAKALQFLNDLAAGRRPPNQTVLPSKLVLGESCGCRSQKVEAAISGLTPTGQKFGLPGYAWSLLRSCGIFNRQRAIRVMKESLAHHIAISGSRDEVLHTTADQLITAFYKELGWGRQHGAFLSALTDAIKTFPSAGVPTGLLQNYISALRHQILPTLWRRGRIIRAEDIWAQGRILVSEAAGRGRDAAGLKSVARERTISQLGAKLVTTHETSAILKVLQQELPKLGIPALYLGVYEGDQGWDRKSIPARLKVLTAFNARGAVRFDGSQAVMAPQDFIPRILAAESSRQTLVAVPLHFNETQIGLAVFGVGPRDGSVYEAIKVQLSASLYGALLRQTLKETLATMETRVAEVSGSSDSINHSVQGGSSAMEGVASSIRDISQHIKDVTDVIRNAVDLTTAAGNNIAVLNKQSDEITKILGLITEIAQQTNMLSLNAAIEAARAGEMGRGFAVVAQEVKNLAVKTVDSSSSIRTMVGGVQENIRRVSGSVSSINEIMQKVSVLSADISNSIYEQESSTNEISGVLLEAAEGISQIAGVLAELDHISKNAAKI